MAVGTDANGTIRKLGEITDAGIFERLATAVLRSASPHLYESLSHPGMNSDGKTVKAPLDGIGWVRTDIEERVVCCAHSTYAQNEIGKKWLHDQSTVKVNNPSGKPTQPEGDLLKAIKEISKFRLVNPALKATIALTSSREPDQSSIAAANKLAAEAHVDLDIWPASRIAYHLDNTAIGQWVRSTHLGGEVELISLSALQEYTKVRMSDYVHLFSAEELVFRPDVMREQSSHMLLVGDSGVGKTTAAMKIFQQHCSEGGVGLIVSHESVEVASSLSDLIGSELKKIESALVGDVGKAALQICTEVSPFMLVVEDINRSASPSLMLNKLLGWILSSKGAGSSRQHMDWKLVCPVWPKHFDSIEHRFMDLGKKHLRLVGVYREDEAIQALELKYKEFGVEINPTAIKLVANALGNDPLLISLYQFSMSLDPNEIVRQYVASDFREVASVVQDSIASEIIDAVVRLIRCMLQNSALNPTWRDINSWALLSDDEIKLLRRIFASSRVMRLVHRDGQDVVIFRHDKIFLSLCGDVIAQDLQVESFSPTYLSDPYFAEAVAVGLCRLDAGLQRVDFLVENNPLSLFYAFQMLSTNDRKFQSEVRDGIVSLLSKPDIVNDGYYTLRNRALKILAGTTSKEVLELCELFPESDKGEAWLEARFRNGDALAGINLLTMFDFGISIPERAELFRQTFSTHGRSIENKIEEWLREGELSERALRGCLILAGYLGAEVLLPSIIARWNDKAQNENNAIHFFWAAARCCGANAEAALIGVFDYWAALPDDQEEMFSGNTRSSFAALELSWEFTKYLPVDAIDYMLSRAKSDVRLLWPVTYMMRAFDNPVVVEHLARYYALRTKAAEQGQLDIGLRSLLSDWRRRARDGGEPMSRESKEALVALMDEASGDEYLLRSAFSVWEASRLASDVAFLKNISAESCLYEMGVFARAVRGDSSAIPDIISLLSIDPGYWWQTGRYVWSQELEAVLYSSIRSVTVEGASEERAWVNGIQAEILMEKGGLSGEKLIIEIWDRVKNYPEYFQAALYFATPAIALLVEEFVEGHENPAHLFKHVMVTWGVAFNDRKGVVSIRQLDLLLKYSEYLQEPDVLMIWSCCNDKAWFDYRRLNVDPLLSQYDQLEGLGRINFNDLRSDSRFPPPISFWVDKNLHLGYSLSDLRCLLLEWFSEAKDLKRFHIIHEFFFAYGTRADFSEFKDNISVLPEVFEILRDLYFSTRIRTLV